MPAHALNVQTKGLAAELRDVAYRTEHVVRNFRERIHSQRLRLDHLQGLKGFIVRIKIQIAISRRVHEFTTSIRELRHRFNFLKIRCYSTEGLGNSTVYYDSESYRREEMQRLREIHTLRDSLHVGQHYAMRQQEGRHGLQVGQHNAMRQQERRPDLLLPDSEELVGIDLPRDEVVKILTQEGATSSKKLRVVAIVGDGPLGKTALAKAVYNSLSKQFDVAVWVTMPRRPGIIKILDDILSHKQRTSTWFLCIEGSPRSKQQDLPHPP